MRSRRPPGSPGPGPGLARRPKQPQEPEAGAEEECDRGSAGAREFASAGMGQQVGRVGEAPGLQQAQPRGSRGSSAARPSGRRRDLAGRTAEAGFNIFTQHGECVREPARGCREAARVGLGRSARQTGSLRGSGGGRVPGSGGGIGCHLGQSREARHTPPPPVSSLAGSSGGGGARSGLGGRRGGAGGRTVSSVLGCGARGGRGGRGRQGRGGGCELHPGGV